MCLQITFIWRRQFNFEFRGSLICLRKGHGSAEVRLSFDVIRFTNKWQTNSGLKTSCAASIDYSTNNFILQVCLSFRNLTQFNSFKRESSVRNELNWIVVLNISDIDECLTTDLAHKHNCHRNATCSNTHGSFRCTCVSVYTGDGVNCTGILAQLI